MCGNTSHKQMHVGTHLTNQQMWVRTHIANLSQQESEIRNVMCKLLVGKKAMCSSCKNALHTRNHVPDLTNTVPLY